MAKDKKTTIPKSGMWLNLPGKPVWYYFGIYLVATIAFFHDSLFSTSKLIFGTDLMAGNVFFRDFFAEYFKMHFSWPVWDQFIHGGMPFVDGMHGDIFYLPTLIFYIIFGIIYAWGFTLALHVFLAGVFMYLFLKEIGIRGKVAFLFGLIYQMAPVFISLVYAGHNGKMFVIALTPLIFFIFHRAINHGKLIYYVLLSFVIFLVMTSPHMQLAYFLFVTLGVYFITIVIQRWRKEKVILFKPAILFTLAVILGLMLSLVQFLTPYEYLKEYSMRTIRTDEGKGYEYSTSWSMHFEEVGALVFPEFCGDNLQGQKPSYWGRNPFKLNSEHFSLIAILLSVLAIGLWRKEGKWFFFLTTIVTLIFALGANTPFFRLFYLLPGINSFRAPSLISFITGFSVITLGAMGLESFLQAKKTDQKLKKTWKIYTWITIGYSVVAMMMIILQMGFFRMWFFIFGFTPDSNKIMMLDQNLGQISIGVLISLIIVWSLYLMLKFYLDKKTKSGTIIAVLAVITFLYMWNFNSRYIITIDPGPYYNKTTIIDYFKAKQSNGQFRTLVMPKTLRDYYLSYHGLEELSFTMLHGNHLATFEKLAGRSSNYPGLIHQSVRDLLNARYIVSNQPLPSQFFPADMHKQVQSFGNIAVYENLSALPRAFPIYDYKVITDENKILAALTDTSFDYRSCIILEKEPEVSLSEYKDSLASMAVPARIYDIKNGSFIVDVDMLADGFLFLSENYYPAWKAYENNQQLTTLKADLTFRAIPLKRGQHTIVCKYENETYNAAFKVSKLTFIFLILSLIGLIIKDRYIKKKE